MLVTQKQLKVKIIVSLLCILFIAIGIIITQNEIYGDEWNIEGYADGLFGQNNISLMHLCSTFIITSLIRLLSLSGLRINWLFIIQLFFEYITFILVFKSLIEQWGTKLGIVFSCLFSIIIIPILFRMHSITNSSAFIIAGGVFWLFDCIKTRRKIIQYTEGVILLLVGFSIRLDTIYFSIFFFGIMWIMDVMLILTRRENRKEMVSEFKRYFIPFVIVFFFIFSLYYSQNIIMNTENPSFYKWNKIRHQVDNYPLPNYQQYRTEYEKIGIKEVDYNLLKTLNNHDIDFFTLEKYKDIIELKNRLSKHKFIDLNLIIKSCGAFFDNGIIGLWLFILFFSILVNNKSLFYKTIIIVVADILLINYFYSIDRFIQRIEWAIWINLLFVILLLQADIKTEVINNLNLKEKALLSVLLFLLVFGIWIPSHGAARWNDLAGKNIYKQYRYVFNLPDNFYNYLNNIRKNKEYNYSTHDPIMEKVLGDKTSIYFVLSGSWLMPCPQPIKDLFRTEPIGTASNWGVLGEYSYGLKPIQRNLLSYNIKNPFKEIINNNIKIISPMHDSYYTTHEIYSYIKEHYHPNLCFSIYEKYANLIVGKYKTPYDTQNMNKTEQEIGLLYGDSSINKFFSIKLVNNFDNYKEKYLQLEDTKGKKYIFVFEKDSNVASFYKEVLDLKGETYKVEIILLSKDGDYSVIKSNKPYKFKEAYKLKNIK